MSDTETRLAEQLATLKLLAVAEQYAFLATEAAQKQWPHVDYLARLIDSEAQRRHQLATQRRVAAARFPCLKTLDQFDWNWPKKINRTQVQNLFRLAFLKDKTNVIFLGGVGLGKTHLASALAYEACLRGHSVLFTTAVDIINTLTRWPPRRRSAGLNLNSNTTSSPPFWPWTSWAICPLTKPAPICSSRSSANVTSKAPSC